MLKTEALTIRHGDRCVLDNVSLGVTPGQFTVLLGRNGAGKSTLLKALADEGSPRQSRATPAEHTTINGERIHAVPPLRLARLRAVLPQAAQAVFPFTVEEIAMLGRYPYTLGRTAAHRDREVVAQALALTDVAHLANRDITTLSGGELARTQLARVLAQIWPEGTTNGNAVAQTNPPRYLLLDEPTAALDLAHQHRMLSMVRELTRNWGIGALAIVHDPNLAARHADTMALLADGRILVHGTPRDVMQPEWIERCFGFAVRSAPVDGYDAPLIVPV